MIGKGKPRKNGSAKQSRFINISVVISYVVKNPT